MDRAEENCNHYEHW